MLLRPFSCVLASTKPVLFLLAPLILFSFGMPDTAHAEKQRVQSASALASYKSRQMAAIGIHRLRKSYKSPYSNARYSMQHVSTNVFPVGVHYEGIGFSKISANQAVRNSSFYGTRQIIVARVARGRDGYYSTVYYR